jgi:hypothetical protein
LAYIDFSDVELELPRGLVGALSKDGCGEGILAYLPGYETNDLGFETNRQQGNAQPGNGIDACFGYRCVSGLA